MPSSFGKFRSKTARSYAASWNFLHPSSRRRDGQRIILADQGIPYHYLHQVFVFNDENIRFAEFAAHLLPSFFAVNGPVHFFRESNDYVVPCLLADNINLPLVYLYNVVCDE